MFYSRLNYYQFKTGTEFYVLDINKKKKNGEDIHMIDCMCLDTERIPPYLQTSFFQFQNWLYTLLNTVRAGENVAGLWNMWGLEESSIAAVLYLDFFC